MITLSSHTQVKKTNPMKKEKILAPKVLAKCQLLMKMMRIQKKMETYLFNNKMNKAVLVFKKKI